MKSVVGPLGLAGGFMEDGEEWPHVGRTFYMPDGSKFIPQRDDVADWDHQRRAYILHRGGMKYELSPGKPLAKPKAEQEKKVRVLKCR